MVDDEEIVRQTARNTLERYGYETLMAKDGAAAVDVYRHRPDVIGLVLLDLTMPVMSGEEALSRIRAIRPNLPVIASSGYNQREAMERFGTSIDGFIEKP